MSFILDALRKSEHARQKQTGPGLAEVPVVARRSRPNVWATAAVLLLVVNLIAVGVLLLRRAADAPAPVADPPTASSAAPAPVPPDATPGAVAASAPPPARTPVPEPTLTPAVSPPTAAAPPATARTASAPAGRNPLAEEVGDAAVQDPAPAAAAARVPQGPPAVTRRGTVTYAPVPEAGDAPYVAPAPRAPAGTGETLPTAEEMAARGGLPALHLDLHVYATQPQQRFVFVNSRKYREGDTLQEGPVVEQITPKGAVLSFRGSRFRLSND